MDKFEKMMRELVTFVLSNGQNLSLLNLRLAYHGMSFATEDDQQIACELLAKAHMACFNLAAENAIFAIQYFSELGDRVALTELYRLAKLYDNREALKLLDDLDPSFSVPAVNQSDIDKRYNPEVDFLFRQYCLQNGLIILRKIQEGVKEIKYCSNVYLILDTDGIIKVFKELLNYKSGPLGQFCNNEDEVYERLKSSELSIHYYGKVEIATDVFFLKFPYHFGESLASKIERERKIPFAEACTIIVQIAKKLKCLHEKGIVHHDLKPEHIILGNNEVDLIDFGVARISGKNRVEAYLASPRYGAPEESKDLRISCASDIFQLGVIFYEMLTGKHPFVLDDSLSENSLEERILKYFWPSVLTDHNHDLIKDFDEECVDLLDRMLSKNPETRPKEDEIISQFEKFSVPIISKRRQKINSKNKNTLLFPARMGIPHRGHIEYITRLIELGFHVIISLQRSYTITDRDPIPKWLVMKIVAESLLNQGVARGNFSFIFTPFYSSQDEMRMHFIMMPGREDIIGVASSNPGIGKLFPEYLNFDQKTVFGREGETFIDQSWGEFLRQAVKAGDYEQFKKYAASGVESIISFDELRQVYALPLIDFVEGGVRVVLLDQDGGELVNARVLRYLSPEQSLVLNLRQKGYQIEILDGFAKDSLVLLNNEKRYFVFLNIEFNGNIEKIYYICT